MMSLMLSGQVTADGGPGTRPLSAVEVRAQKLAETADEVPCPGGCGASAWLEHSVTVAYRDGVTRRYRMATCDGTCVKADGSKGRPRFEVPIAAEEAAPSPTYRLEKPMHEAERKAVKTAMKKREVSVFIVADELRLDFSKLRKWLDKGKGLNTETVARLQAWADAEPTPKPAAQQPSPVPSATVSKTYRRSSPVQKADDDRVLARVREALAVRELTGARLAKEVEVSQSRISGWLRGLGGLGSGPLARLDQWADDVFAGEKSETELPPVPSPRREETVLSEPSSPVVAEDLPIELDEPEDLLGRYAPGDPPCCPTAPTESPADAILTAHLERVARVALLELAPELVHRIELGIVLTWRKEEAAK